MKTAKIYLTDNTYCFASLTGNYTIEVERKSSEYRDAIEFKKHEAKTIKREIPFEDVDYFLELWQVNLIGRKFIHKSIKF